MAVWEGKKQQTPTLYIPRLKFAILFVRISSKQRKFKEPKWLMDFQFKRQEQPEEMAKEVLNLTASPRTFLCVHRHMHTQAHPLKSYIPFFVAHSVTSVLNFSHFFPCTAPAISILSEEVFW